MCQTNALFDRTCSDKINTVFPQKEAQASISYRVVKIEKKNEQTGTRTRVLMVEDYQTYHQRAI